MSKGGIGSNRFGKANRRESVLNELVKIQVKLNILVKAQNDECMADFRLSDQEFVRIHREAINERERVIQKLWEIDREIKEQENSLNNKQVKQPEMSRIK